jgi:hypothetical protein
MSHRHKCRTLFASLLLLVPMTSARAASFDEILSPLGTPTSQCREIEGVHAYSSQAPRLYEKEFAATLNLASEASAARSFECKGSKATVYLYSYAGAPEAQKAEAGIKTYIWGGSTRSTYHPEYIFTVDNIVVVVSGAKPKYIASLLAPKK